MVLREICAGVVAVTAAVECHRQIERGNTHHDLSAVASQKKRLNRAALVGIIVDPDQIAVFARDVAGLLGRMPLIDMGLRRDRLLRKLARQNSLSVLNPTVKQELGKFHEIAWQ
jgi:hypothetical protein